MPEHRSSPHEIRPSSLSSGLRTDDQPRCRGNVESLRKRGKFCHTLYNPLQTKEFRIYSLVGRLIGRPPLPV